MKNTLLNRLQKGGESINKWGILLFTFLALAGCAVNPPSSPPMTMTPIGPTATRLLEVVPVTPMPLGTGKRAAYIRIPALGVQTEVRPIGWTVVGTPQGRYTEWQVLLDAAGQHRGTANPGERGNLVISGHNTPGGKVFEGLSTLGYERGNTVQRVYAYVTVTDGRTYVYRLEKKALLPVLGTSKEEQRQYLQYTLPTDTAWLTLITCWPLGDTSYRLVVGGPLVGVVHVNQVNP